jgi:hypothetical protein
MTLMGGRPGPSRAKLRQSASIMATLIVLFTSIEAPDTRSRAHHQTGWFQVHNNHKTTSNNADLTITGRADLRRNLEYETPKFFQIITKPSHCATRRPPRLPTNERHMNLFQDI